MMTSWIQTKKQFSDYGLGFFDVPDYVMNYIKSVSTEQMIPFNKDLAGHIKREYAFQNVPQNVKNYFCKCSVEGNLSNIIKDINVLTSDVPIVLDKLWINYQKKYEYNPFHKHSGFMSFVLFVQIPYNLSDEENVFSKINERNTNNTTSKLTFFNIGKLGEPVFSPVNVDKSFEGKMIMFSAKQFHGVYPFYTSDNYRITVSGNLKFKTYGNNDI